MQTPTDELYSELQEAYIFFNDNLFNGILPGCLFTLQRKQNTFGYYSSSRFLRRDARRKSDEISLNPIFFAFRSIEQTLSTLLHEMVHQWQTHFGKPSRSGYHNREWSEKMESLGLMPSNTGEVGGNRVGQKMTHYIIEGGAFALTCEKLLQMGVMISWVDIVAKRVPLSVEVLLGRSQPDEVKTAVVTDQQQNTKIKIKYTCPICATNIWGKPGLLVGCLNCNIPFEKNSKGTQRN